MKKIRGFSNKRRATLLLGLLAIILVIAAVIMKLAQPKSLRAWVPPFGHQTAPSPTVSTTPVPGGGLVKPQGTPGATPISNPDHPISSSLAAPIGKPLVSNHRVSLTSYDPTLNPAEESTCQTVPGATCEIRLTASNGRVVSAGSKSVDDQGAAVIDWNAKDLGLTPGSWKVEAVATKDGQTAVSSAETLDVQP